MSEINVREGTGKDLHFIRQLALDSILYSVPQTRNIDKTRLKKEAQSFLDNLDLNMESKNFKILVAEDKEKKQLAGYIMLLLNDIEESTGEKQAFIYDLAVSPDFWGKFVVDKLIKKAEKIAREKGLGYLTGKVTINNKRALVYALKRLDFKIERYQITRVLES
ncbi:MAG: GNAT family N-acetyltransferase [Vulcanimicrobiota bacterium]